MAVTTTARLGLTRWSAGSDPFTRAQMDASHAALEASAVLFVEGTLAARPAAGVVGRFYRVTDAAAEAPTMFWDTGAAWVEIRPDLSGYATDADLTAGLAGKAAAGHTHAAADVTSGVFAVARLGSGAAAAGKYVDGGTGAWTALPVSNVSSASDVVITAIANGQVLRWNSATSKWVNVTLATSDVSGLDTALAGKAASSHSHAIGDLPVAASGASNTTQLVRADDARLSDARTPTAHNHVKADITDFAHSHTISDLPVAASGTSNSTQLVRADDLRLSNARTPTTHSHAIADLPVAASGTSSATQLVRADDARLSNARTPTAHTHATSDVTGLDTALAAKAPISDANLVRPRFQAPQEFVGIAGGGMGAAYTYEAADYAVLLFPSAATANSTINIRGNAGSTLNALLAVSESLTIAVLVTNGATAYRPTTWQIDGVAVTPKWAGGAAPAAGSANAIDAYQLTIIKTAATPTYAVLASVGKYS